jgi:hypothetical protein
MLAFTGTSYNMKWSLPSLACCSSREDTLAHFLICYISWVLANIMTESSCCFWKCDRNSGCRFCIMVHPDLGRLLYTQSTPTIRSWWSQWVVMAACHCYLWCRWWSDTLWATLIRFWLHLLLCYLQIAVLEISGSTEHCKDLGDEIHKENIWVVSSGTKINCSKCFRWCSQDCRRRLSAHNASLHKFVRQQH